jgi:hypothetical protein
MNPVRYSTLSDRGYLDYIAYVVSRLDPPPCIGYWLRFQQVVRERRR